MQTKV